MFGTTARAKASRLLILYFAPTCNRLGVSDNCFTCFPVNKIRGMATMIRGGAFGNPRLVMWPGGCQQGCAGEPPTVCDKWMTPGPS
ncbi:hypothetical protein EV401DRAFT_1961157 [Pisolithus croceorrhizus]|nr:hypothetical protein EV401DRAFT_1961157 [Pisolithus croceorrhizus]